MVNASTMNDNTEEVETQEGQLFSSFDKLPELQLAQRTLLLKSDLSDPEAGNDSNMIAVFKILDEYQEQAYLLDPFLDLLVSPIIEAIKAYARNFSSTTQRQTDIYRPKYLALLLYHYIKFRGYKAIVHFFPNQVSDLSVVLGFMIAPDSPVHNLDFWALRYVMLLWLSLIAKIPFDLAQFNAQLTGGDTMSSLETIAKEYLGSPGLEREAAALLLSTFLSRNDTTERFPDFVFWSFITIGKASNIFTAIGILHVYCEFVKSGPTERILLHVNDCLRIIEQVKDNPFLINNTVVRKFVTKLTGRVGIRLLPPKSMKRNVKTLEIAESSATVDEGAESLDVPQEIELILESLFSALQDKDTIVRWSAAKGIARISQRLPVDFRTQVFDEVLNLFAIHPVVSAILSDIPAVAESTWHGTCLACAELARRDLIPPTHLPRLVEHMSKALCFDIRKGSHSIGANVRDAASYVLWALARTQRPSSFAVHANDMAARLVAVSVFDREVHIRRAASAAFQEHVGRMGIFPHGIDVLGKTDFYAISQRRNAFLMAAPQVAEHHEYRLFMVNHLITVTIRHWDPAMRRLAAQSLGIICSTDLLSLVQDVGGKVATLLTSVDVADIHGALLVLSELASYSARLSDKSVAEETCHELVSYLNIIPLDVIESPRNALIAEGACSLIANGLTSHDTALDRQRSTPYWLDVVRIGFRHRTTNVQEAASAAMGAASKLMDCTMLLHSLIEELSAASPPVQQGLGMLLGSLDYTVYSNGLQAAVTCLLSGLDKNSPRFISDVESRSNCYSAIPKIIHNVVLNLEKYLQANVVCSLLETLLRGLEDYTSDQRGDVGSWVRIACIRALGQTFSVLFDSSPKIPKFQLYCPAMLYHESIQGILKQGVERLDNVRQEAGTQLLHLVLLPLPQTTAPEDWRIYGKPLIDELFVSESNALGWQDSARLYPRVVRLLEISEYRSALLSGLITSIGTKTDSTQWNVTSSLVGFVQNLPTESAGQDYTKIKLVTDLLNYMKGRMAANSIVIPTLQTFNALLEGETLDSIIHHASGQEILESLLSLVNKNLTKIKSLPRIHQSMKITVNMLSLNEIRMHSIRRLENFLGHTIPKVRSDTAEYLYLVLQEKNLGVDTDEVEDILLETEWLKIDRESAAELSGQIIQLLASDTEVDGSE